MHKFHKLVNLVVALSMAVLFVFQGNTGVSAKEAQLEPQAAPSTRHSVRMVTDDAGNILEYEVGPALPAADVTESKSASSVEPAAAETVIIFEEGFEGEFPGTNWSLLDGTPNKEYLWGPTTRRAHTGLKSAWHAVGGADGYGVAGNATFPPNNYTRMVYGPFSLADATSARLDFYMWKHILSGQNMNLAVLVSTDMNTWGGMGITGSSNGWETDTMDLGNIGGTSLLGEPQVYLNFVFEDKTSNTTYEGIYIDDIVITKTVATQTCYSLTTTALPSGSGSVTVNTPANCEGTKYTSGTQVQLTANANPGYTFANWSGGAQGATNPVTITMNGNKEVTANFTTTKYTLTTSVQPSGAGAIQASPTGPYDPNTTVNLTATANPGFEFASWSGAASGTNPSTSVLMDGSKSVTANFNPLCYDLTLSFDSARGSVTASPAPNCNGNTQYSYNTRVTLTATRKTGYTFTGWSGGASGTTSPVDVYMTEDRAVTASFGDLCYTISATAGAGGSVSKDKEPNCGDKYREGTSLKITATPNTGYDFTGWSGDQSGSTNPLTFTVTADKTIAANFAVKCYALTTEIDPIGGGEIERDVQPNCASGTLYSHGTVVKLTAKAGQGHSFTNWTGDVPSVETQITVTMDGTRTVRANFEVLCYSLTTQVSPSGAGSVTASAPNCGDKYRYNTDVILNASANPGYTFASWTGASNPNTAQTTVKILGNTTVTANFADRCFSVTASANPAQGGSVEITDPNCGADKYLYDTQVTVTAHPAAGHTFTGWEGDLTSEEASFTFRVTEDVELTAGFAIQCFTLTKTPGTGGSITASPQPNCGAQYKYGTQVSLEATPGSGYEFTGWGGDLSGTKNPTTLTIDEDKTVTASFAALCYSLSTSVYPSGAGSVNVSPAPDCGDKYSYDTQVTLAPVAADGHTFTYWEGSQTGSANPLIFKIRANTTVVANFEADCYPLTVLADSARGSASASGPGLCATNSYYHGTQVTLTAAAKPGFEFTGWTGGVETGEAQTTFTITGPTTVTANFAAACFSLDVQVDPAGAGSVEVDKQPTCNGNTEYAYNTDVKLTAKPKQGHTFTGWGGDLTSTELSVTVRMDRDWELTAVFDDQCFTLTTAANPAAGGSVQVNTTPDCGTQYSYGKQVELQAKANPGYAFNGWDGDSDDETATITVTMNKDVAVTAKFAMCYTLTLNAGTGGEVTASPAPNCGAQYRSGTQVSLTASPATGYAFSGWSGDLTGSANPASVVMSANRTVTAAFAPTASAPVLTSISQTTILSGTKDVRLTLTGSGFVAQSGITWNGTPLTGVVYVSPTELQVVVPASLLKTPGKVQIVVTNPPSAGGSSNAVELEIVSTLSVYLPVAIR